MTEIVEIQAVPAVIEFDFVALKERLTKELVAYNIEVTTDNLAEAKTKATELNKLSNELDSKRKEKVAEISAPIKEFESQIKELVSMAQEGRTKILAQVQVFEDKIRAVARRELLELRDKLYTEQEIQPAYQKADVESLAIISNLTEKMKLTKKATDQVTLLVQECRAKQDRHKMREALAVSKSLEAGLKTPLRHQDLSFFLVDSDQEFEDKLANRISSELEKQRVIEERAIEAERAKQAQAEPRMTQSPKVESTKPAPEGKKIAVVQATFEIELLANYAGDIAQVLEKKLRDAGFTTLTEVEVIR